jgi:hypothetical protein
MHATVSRGLLRAEYGLKSRLAQPAISIRRPFTTSNCWSWHARVNRREEVATPDQEAAPALGGKAEAEEGVVRFGLITHDTNS